MYRKSGTHVSFAETGLARREIFSHNVIAIPKPYPDAQLLLERSGLPREELEGGQFFQLNLYTTDFYGLPLELFSDPEINWHRQQLGQKGLIAAAGLWIRNSVATISTLQSDLCQQLYRNSVLKQLCKTRVDTHFKYWYVILFNAIMDFCLDFNISMLHCPTGHHIVENTRKKIRPDLFFRIYDYPAKEYHCDKISLESAEYWKIPVETNRGRVAPLAATTRSVRRNTASAQVCIVHDIEENVDTNISPVECADNLARMLQIEKQFGVVGTYNILGTLFSCKKDEILASNPNHSIGFHSFNHNLADLAQLRQCRAADLRVRGYRPPQSKITSELTDYNLTRLNFEWFACGTRSLGYSDCKLQNGIAKIPIHFDDYPLFLGLSYEQWESNLLSRARATPIFGLGLHDCYAGKWLDRYMDLLDKLATIKKFESADAICDSLFLDEPRSLIT